MKMFIAGEWVTADEMRPVYNPYDNSVVDEMPVAKEAEVEKALESAVRGASVMEKMPYWKRSEIINKAADIFASRKENIARLISQENGKTINEARGEVDRTVTTLKSYADAIKSIFGETLPLTGYAANGVENKFGFTYRVPYGVVLAISPFNMPVNIPGHKIAAALAAGNSVVFKSASDTPLAAVHLVESFLEAGLPEEAIQYITGSGGKLGVMLSADQRVRNICFTGSYATGHEICKAAGMRKVVMELGGNAPVVVMPDASIDRVVSTLSSNGYYMAGQACVSPQRAYVHQSIYEEVIERMREAVTAKYVLGNPLDEQTTMGPLIRHADAVRVAETIGEVASKGGRILCGGKLDGNFVTPAVVADCTQDMRICREELFGPAIAFMPFTDLDDAIEKANDTEYGLCAGLFTESIEAAMQIAHRVKSGLMHINSSNWRIDHMPNGGVKNSGIGKEGGIYGILEMTESRTVIMHLTDRAPY